jgi:hypothetical protein
MRKSSSSVIQKTGNIVGKIMNNGLSSDRFYRQRASDRRNWIAAAIIGLLLLIFAAVAGRMLIVNHPLKSDTIVVLAGETDRRLDRGLQLLDQGYGRTLILDVPAAAKIYGFTELQLARKYIDSLPDAASIRICPIEGLSTKAESHEVEKCLTPADSNVLIVTSEFHTRRALSIFRHELRGRSFSVAAAYDETQFGVDWWKHRQWAKTLVDEWLRLIWWNLVDRWH